LDGEARAGHPGTPDPGDPTGGVLRFSPGQVATGRAPLVLPAPRWDWTSYPLLVKVLGYLLLSTSFVTLYLAAAAWENFLFGHGDRLTRAEFYFGAIHYSACTFMCLWGARGMIVRDDPDRGFVAGLCLVGALLSPVNLWDTGVMDMPGGACGAYYLVLALTVAFLLVLHIVRRRRAFIEAAGHHRGRWGWDGGRP